MDRLKSIASDLGAALDEMDERDPGADSTKLALNQVMQILNDKSRKGLDDGDAPIEIASRPPKLKTRGDVNRARADIGSRIDEIIREVNETNPSGRSKNYIGGVMEQDVDVNGVLRHVRPAQGYSLIEQKEAAMEKARGERIVGGGAAGGKKRKKRADAGTKRVPSDWIKFVKAVQKSEGIGYKEAMKVASQMKKDGYTISDL